MLRKGFAAPDMYRTQREFYDNAEHVHLVNTQIKEFPREVMKYRKDKTYLLLPAMKRANKRIKTLRKRKEKTKSERLKKYIDKQIQQIQNDFNKKYELRQK